MAEQRHNNSVEQARGADLCRSLRRPLLVPATTHRRRCEPIPFPVLSHLSAGDEGVGCGEAGSGGAGAVQGQRARSGAVRGSAGPAKRDGEPRLLSKESERRGVLFISEIV